MTFALSLYFDCSSAQSIDHVWSHFSGSGLWDISLLHALRWETGYKNRPWNNLKSASCRFNSHTCRCHPTAPDRTASPAQVVLWPTGFLCGWLVGLEFPCRTACGIRLLAGTVSDNFWRRFCSQRTDVFIALCRVPAREHGIRASINCIWGNVVSISISFSIAQTPTVRPRAHYIVISCYSEFQYSWLSVLNSLKLVDFNIS